MRKVLVLNPLEFTSKKSNILDQLFSEYLRVSNLTLEELPNAGSYLQLHYLTYSKLRKTSFLPSDIIQEARKDVWAKRRNIKKEIKNCAIRLNKRWFRYSKTRRETPIFKITYSPRKSIVIPIKKDRQFQRFSSFLCDNWSFDNISLLKGGKIAVVLEKEFPKPKEEFRYILGIDIGSSTLAAVTIFDKYRKRIIKQLYFGTDIAHRQRKYLERRSKLQAFADKGSRKARKSLKKLKNKQRNFVKTRSGEIAKEIVTLAKKYNASISIEKLKNLRGKKKKFNKKAKQKINLIPYAKFKEYLYSNAEMSSIPIKEVDAYHTSKWCPECGALNDGHHSGNYALYKCKKCRYICNSDRKASLSIAVKSLLERTEYPNVVQISNRRASVNGLMRPHEAGNFSAVQSISQSMEKAHGFIRG